MKPDTNNPDSPVDKQKDKTSLSPETPGKVKPLIARFVMAAVVLVLTAAGIYWLFHGTAKPAASDMSAKAPAQTTNAPSATANISGVQLDPAKNYGDKYADGILPVGDGKFQTDAAKQGYVYACSGYAQNMQNSQGGAGRRGPWFIGTTKYDLNKKLHVQGKVSWQTQFSDVVSGATRTITTNGLPAHTTGVFPISAANPAYAYDRNPNAIQGQAVTYQLDTSPAYGDPSCIGGQVGVMLTGAALFSGFDAAGRDAGAWEVQDSCDGHPEKNGTYHYHTLSSCIKNIGVDTVIGFALDGFAITGPQVAAGSILTSADLDVCHGLTSSIVLNGKKVSTYHYVMTQDFPYSVSCYRGKAIQPPGQASGGTRKPGQ